VFVSFYDYLVKYKLKCSTSKCELVWKVLTLSKGTGTVKLRLMMYSAVQGRRDWVGTPVKNFFSPLGRTNRLKIFTLDRKD
jgi:hypothetical protein